MGKGSGCNVKERPMVYIDASVLASSKPIRTGYTSQPDPLPSFDQLASQALKNESLSTDEVSKEAKPSMSKAAWQAEKEAKGEWLSKEDWVAQQQAKTEEMLESLEGRLDEFRSDPQAKQLWLNDLVDREMYTYSLSNYSLVRLFRPGATRVLSKTKWRQQGYKIRKGAKSIPVLVPVLEHFKLTDANGKPLKDEKGRQKSGTKIRRGAGGQPILKLGRVYDIGDMEAIPGKVKPSTQSKGAERCIQELQEVSERRGIQVFRGGVDDPNTGFRSALNAELLTSPNAGGYHLTSDQGEVIVTRKGLSPDEEARVIAHELGHAVLGHQGYTSLEDRQQKELEAESVAYCLTRAYEVENLEAPAYIDNWVPDDEGNRRFRQSSERIRKAVGEVLKEVSQ